MRTRLVQWLDMKSPSVRHLKWSVIFGIQVFDNGKWKHAHRSGKPMFYRTREQAEKARAILRKSEGKS